MIIKITNLPVGIHAFSFVKTVKELQLDEPFINNMKLDCTLDKSQHQIVVNCNLTISAKLFCDRCNNEFTNDFNSEFTLLYLHKREDSGDTNESVKYLSPTDDKIDLTEDVIDFANLSLPMKKLCSEDCAGLCTKCGSNLNENKCNCKEEINNPIWEPLLKLKDKLN